MLVISADVSTKTVGRKEGSGYTHAYNVEPITFHSGSPHTNHYPVSIPVKETLNLSYSAVICFLDIHLSPDKTIGRKKDLDMPIM